MSKPVEVAKSEPPPVSPVVPDPEKPNQEEATTSRDEKERTPSPPLKVDPNESEAMKELKAKLK